MKVSRRTTLVALTEIQKESTNTRILFGNENVKAATTCTSVASASEEEDDLDELQLGLDVGGMIPLAGGVDG